MGTYSKKRMVAGRKGKPRSPSTQLLQDGTPSPPSKVTRTSPRSATKKLGSRRESCNATGWEQKAHFNYYTNTFLASPSKNTLARGKPCGGFTTKETNRMTQHISYSKDRIAKMIDVLEKRQMSKSQQDVIRVEKTMSELSTMKPRKLTYHRRGSQLTGRELGFINISHPVQIEQVEMLQGGVAAAGPKARSGDRSRSARMTNFPGFRIKQLLKAKSVDQVIACHMEGEAREKFQGMLRCETILKNVGTEMEINELGGSGEGSTKVVPKPVIENEGKRSKLLPLAGLMMSRNRQHEGSQMPQSDPVQSTSTFSSQTSASPSAVQLSQNDVKVENTADPSQIPERMIIWTREGAYSIVTCEGVTDGFYVEKVFADVGEGTPDDPVVIDDD